MLRRTFLRLAASTPIALYSEPWALVVNAGRKWVEDRGEYLVIRIPENEMFRDEELTKPAIVFMGRCAVMKGVRTEHFTNIFGAGYNAIFDTYFDGRKIQSERPRALVEVKSKGEILIGSSLFYCGPGTESALRVTAPDLTVASVRNCYFSCAGKDSIISHYTNIRKEPTC